VRRALSRARTGRRWLRWFGRPDAEAELPERPVAVERIRHPATGRIDFRVTAQTPTGVPVVMLYHEPKTN